MGARIQAFCEESGQPIPESPGELVRCIMESLALRYRQALEQAERLTGRVFGGLHMVGGGIRNRTLCQFTANALGRPVWAGPVEASAIGNILAQLIATGDCADLKAARRLVADSFPIDVYEPDGLSAWESAYERFISLGRGE
ncbi:MAG: rhamnulokinase, partial [Cohnella sp.]|nr:rhamnulokinase [Cohnella sp.]